MGFSHGVRSYAGVLADVCECERAEGQRVESQQNSGAYVVLQPLILRIRTRVAVNHVNYESLFFFLFLLTSWYQVTCVGSGLL